MRKLRQSDYYEVAPIQGDLPYGAVVSGLDPAGLVEEQLRQDLRELWTDEGLLLFKGVDGQETHLALSSVFGKMVEHPVPEIRTKHPSIVDLVFDPADGAIISVDGEPRGFPLEWHKDLIYVEKINRAGVLRPIELPSRLGETGFIDQISAYDRLPSDLKERIEGLTVSYYQEVDPAKQRFGRCHDMKFVRINRTYQGVLDRAHELPVVLHPMIYTQQETGRKVLNISPWFATGILELPGQEGDELLEKLARHIVDSDLIYMHEWHLGEMLLWDNWRMLHSTTGAPVDEKRWMQRTTIFGDYGLGRIKGDKVEVGASVQ